MNYKKTMRLETLAETFDLNLWSLRKMASQRSFPGIIKRGRSIYVNVAKFEEWFLGHELQNVQETRGDLNHE